MKPRSLRYVCPLVVLLPVVLLFYISPVEADAWLDGVAALYSEDFEAYASGTDPVDWLDTDANSSLVENDSLFKVFDLSGQRVFSTTSTLDNIHSHYVGAGSLAFSSYEYSGRMRITAADSGIGVTFFSQYPGADAYYRLGRHGSGSFQISAHGTSTTGGTTDTGVVPAANAWYRYRVEVEDTGAQTEIRARVWAEGATEPSGWQADCYDASSTRLVAGTVGVWAFTSGGKYWDDLVVESLPSALDESPPYAHGHDPAPGATNVDLSSNVIVHVADSGTGVDSTSLTMTVEGVAVAPVVTGSPPDYTLTYDPPADFDDSEVVTVTVDACDLAVPANCMDTEVYSFTTLSKPAIDVWYGSHQVFGHLGIPQEWIDILGNVSDPEGVAALTYSLNGGPGSPLSIGPDGRRLAAEGDFNVEIAYADLIDGLNDVVIIATDNLSNTTAETVTVEYVSGNVWPDAYSIDWSAVSDIPDVAQIVDGLWTLERNSIHPAAIGYDRMVAIGDISWDDYEITVPVTINAAPPDPDTGGVGVLMRWQGHQGSAQPRTEWWHMGAYGYYRWRSSGPHLALRLDQNPPIQNSSVQLDVGTRYNFKMRVETIPGQPGGLYSLKVWEHGQAQPSGWDLYAQDGSADLQNGSLLLLAHQVDASFGDVTITPGPFDDTTPPIISDIQVAPGETSVTITWTTNEPATSSVAYGPSAAYENGSVDDSSLVTEHTITLTSLIPGSIYHYQVTSVDGSGNTASSSDLTFRTSGVSPGIVSDDFNACSLDTQVWEFIDPLGDATLTMVGTYTDDAWVSISVPGGVQHTMSSSNQDAPRIMQPVNDTDFEIEVKFESALDATYQLQGVLIEEEENQHFLRFDFFSDSPYTKIFAGVYDDGSLSSRIHQVVAGTDVAPLYMRVRREGDEWTQSYSFNGDDWTTSGSFEHALTVSKVGAFVGNSDDADPPAHTAFVDYFFNTVSPIIPEDGERNTITIHTVGSGTVDVVPDPPYACGDVVTLTARATEPGWSFSSWSGDLSGSVNPITATMTGSRVVTATFTRRFFLPLVTNQYSP